jgi:hypothetical protein
VHIIVKKYKMNVCDNVANFVVEYILCDFEAGVIKNDKE